MVKNKKSGKKFLVLGITMTILAILFVFYALNNTQKSYPWNNYITYMIYISYITINVIIYFLAWKYIKKHRKE